jgi:DNA-binding XRE family transcriptional regulator
MVAPGKLREWRTTRGLSQTRAAQLVGVTQTTWSAWERGRKRPELEAVIALERDADDPVHDQTELIDVSWGLWTIAHKREQVTGWTEEAWKNARVFSSLRHYTTTRDYMISRHLLRWRNPAKHRVGIDLTRSGECVLDTLARKDKPPSPIHVPVQGKIAGA